MSVPHADADPSSPPHRGRKAVHWRRDPAILERLKRVEERALSGESNLAIAAALDIDEATVRRDRKRLNELWLEQVGGEVRARRQVRIAQLDAIAERALKAATFDERMERAVLLDEPMGYRTCSGNVDHGEGRVCEGPHKVELKVVERGEKGIVQFRGNKSGSLNVARQAIEAAAKIEGLVVDRQEVTGRDGGPIEVDTAGLSDEERAARIAELLARAKARSAADAGGA